MTQWKGKFNVTFNAPVGVVQTEPGATATVVQDGETITVVAETPQKTSAERCEEALGEIEGWAPPPGNYLWVKAIRSHITELESEIQGLRDQIDDAAKEAAFYDQ